MGRTDFRPHRCSATIQGRQLAERVLRARLTSYHQGASIQPSRTRSAARTSFQMTDVTRRRAVKGLSAIPLLSSMRPAASGAGGTHIAVVGAGAFGGWAAWHLRRMGAQVTLLDAWGPGNSRSSSGGESRLIRSLYGPDRIYVEWVARSLALWRQSQERWKTQLYQRTGILWMCQDDSYVKASLPIAKELGIRVDRLERSDAGRRFPQVNFRDVKTVYFEPEAGYLKARLACRAVRDQVERDGAKYLQVAAKPSTVRSGALERLDLANGAHLVADQYVFACGPWLGGLFPGVLGESIRPTRQEVYYFGTPAGDRSFEPGEFPSWVDIDERLFYGFPSVEQRGVKIADDTRGEEFDPTDGDRSPSIEGIGRARRFLAHRFPRLRSAPLVEARVCQYANSLDGHLIVDHHPEARNVWLVGGGSGHGFKLSPALGEHVAQCVLGEASPEPMFSLGRLAKLKAKSTQFDRPQ